MPAEIVILALGGSMHHAKPLLMHFGARALVESEWVPEAVMRHLPSLVITFDEHGAELGLCVAEAKKHNISTLLVRDGILEWRMVWEYETSASKRPINQPILSHKVACLGRADARILESWGNVGTCEVVGCPRFDPLVEMKHPIRTNPIENRPLRLLVMTAKSPGFTPAQIETTFQSLVDLKCCLAQRPDIQVIWRVTQNLHKRLGVENTVRDVLSTELHDILAGVDAVITTPSTAILEAMLFGHPLALLDYHNRPHYVPTAWRINCKSHINQVIDHLKTAPLAWMLYQDYCLHDALSCRTPAMNRMVRLIEEMLRIRRDCLEQGKPIMYPHRILDLPDEHVSWPSKAFDLERLYPRHKVFCRRDMTVMQAELEAALGTIDNLNNQNAILITRLHRIPGYKLAASIARKLKK